MKSIVGHYDQYPLSHFMSDSALKRIKSRTLLKRLFPLPKGINKILDVGCGAGAIVERLAVRYWHRKITAVDNSSVSLKAAKKLAPADYHLADALRLPFSKNSFDLVLACGVIHHITTYRLALAEINRVLRPGGWFYLTVYNYAHPYRLVYSGFGCCRRFQPRFWQAVFSLPYCLVYNLASLLILGRLAGFKEARADLADRLFVPLARFFPPRELTEIFQANHWQVIASGRHALGTMKSFILKKHA